METVEIIIYIVIALGIGMLLVAFIGGWNAQGTFESMKNLFKPKATEYTKIESAQLARAVVQAWEECGLGTADLNRTVYVSDSAPLNKTLIFQQVRQANLCSTIQWNDSSCGTRDDVSFADTQGPKVLRLQCDSATRRLIIT